MVLMRVWPRLSVRWFSPRCGVRNPVGVEPLEGRRLLAAFAVTNGEDSGAGSLRQAILDANAAAGRDTITFALGGARVISPTAALPEIFEAVVIDGTSQPGYAGVALVRLDGALAGAGVAGLTVSGGGSSVRGLIVTRFGGDGIVLAGGEGNRVFGNLIGTDAAGSAGLGNGGNGLVVNSGSGVVGGSAAGAGNVISGNAGSGVTLAGTSNVVGFNRIGTNPAGTAALGNGGVGLLVLGSGHRIGAGEKAGPNVISGNAEGGVQISGLLATGNVVGDNFVGTAGGGTTAVGNAGAGIAVIGASGNSVTNNTIAFNSGDGVSVVRDSPQAIGNKVSGNSIFSNGGLGIDLNNDGATENDAGDGDDGPHTLVNFPVLASAEPAGAAKLRVQGIYSGVPGGRFSIEVYAVGPEGPDASGFGEGRRRLGTLTVRTGAAGTARFDRTFAGVLPSDGFVTALAYDADFNTSEFARAAEVRRPLVFTVTNTNDSGAGSLRQAILDANATPGIDAVAFDLTGPSFTIAPSSALPPVTEAVVFDGTTQAGFAGAPLVELNGAAAGGGADGIVLMSGGSTVRGFIIRGFAGAGVRITAAAGGSVVQGNVIGAGVGGAPGNEGDGVRIDGAEGVVIGGAGRGAGNVISGNGGNGVRVIDARDVVIRGNRIGTDRFGTEPIGNGGAGIAVDDSEFILIGGTRAARANVIAGNGGAGVAARGTSQGVSVRGNAIFDNQGVPVDLGDDGATANDRGDADAGPNDLQNFPVVTTAGFDAEGALTVIGTFNGAPGTKFDLDVFVHEIASADGFAETGRFVGTFSVTTGARGRASFARTFPGAAVAAGGTVSATASRGLQTSEHSPGVPAASGAGVIAVTGTPLRATGGERFRGIVATLADARFTSPGAYAARIDWGDDTRPTRGAVTVNADGVVEVRGSHTYRTPGVFDVEVTVRHEDGRRSKATSVVRVRRVENGR